MIRMVFFQFDDIMCVRKGSRGLRSKNISDVTHKVDGVRGGVVFPVRCGTTHPNIFVFKNEFLFSLS